MTETLDEEVDYGSFDIVAIQYTLIRPCFYRDFTLNLLILWFSIAVPIFHFSRQRMLCLHHRSFN